MVQLNVFNKPTAYSIFRVVCFFALVGSKRYFDRGENKKSSKQKKMVQTLGKSDIHFYFSNILFKGVLFSVHSFPLKKKKKLHCTC